MGEKHPGREESVGYEQARRLRATMTTADIDRGRLWLWLYYYSIGRDVEEYELDAYLHHSLLLPRLQRDRLAHAAHETLTTIDQDRAGPGGPASARPGRRGKGPRHP